VAKQYVLFALWALEMASRQPFHKLWRTSHSTITKALVT